MLQKNTFTFKLSKALVYSIKKNNTFITISKTLWHSVLCSGSNILHWQYTVVFFRHAAIYKAQILESFTHEIIRHQNALSKKWLKMTSFNGFVLNFFLKITRHQNALSKKWLKTTSFNGFVLNFFLFAMLNSSDTVFLRLARWRSGKSVRFAVGRPEVHSPCRVIPKDFKKWYLELPCLALGIYRRLWRTSRQVCLLCPWARHLTLSLPRSSIDDLVFSVFTSNFFKLSYKISLIKIDL